MKQSLAIEPRAIERVILEANLVPYRLIGQQDERKSLHRRIETADRFKDPPRLKGRFGFDSQGTKSRHDQFRTLHGARLFESRIQRNRGLIVCNHVHVCLFSFYLV